MVYDSDKRRLIYRKYLKKHPLINIYQSMISRCYNKNNTGYKYYGARGIEVCNEWLSSYENFQKDMGTRPEGTSLDRIDPNGNYEPNNCRWADNHTQALNKRPSGVIKEKYISIRQNKKSKRYRVAKGSIDKVFRTLEEAIEFRDNFLGETE